MFVCSRMRLHSENSKNHPSVRGYHYILSVCDLFRFICVYCSRYSVSNGFVLLCQRHRKSLGSCVLTIKTVRTRFIYIYKSLEILVQSLADALKKYLLLLHIQLWQRFQPFWSPETKRRLAKATFEPPLNKCYITNKTKVPLLCCYCTLWNDVSSQNEKQLQPQEKHTRYNRPLCSLKTDQFRVCECSATEILAFFSHPPRQFVK